MSERSAHSVCRKDDDVGYENVFKQMSGRSAHSESRKHDEVGNGKSSKQMSEHSRSKNDDEVQYKKPSKRKHDEPAAESEAESEHVSNTVDRQGSTKEQKSYKSSTLKEKADDEVRQHGPKDQEFFKSPQKDKEADVHEASQTSKVQHDAGDVTGSKLTKRTQFMRIFTYEDHKIILKALYETGYTTGSKPFWDRIGHTLQLSIPADQKQVYSKVRRLRDDYLKGYRENFSKRERRIYDLSDQIWSEVAKAKAKAKAAAVQPPRKKAKHKQEVVAVLEEEEEEDNYDMKLEKFVRGLHNDVKFPVVESLEVVDGSKRSRLQKKWNDLNGYMFKLYMTKIDLIRETMEAVVP